MLPVSFCVPCMVNNLVVKVHYGVCNRQPLAEGKGVYREVESEEPVRRGGKP